MGEEQFNRFNKIQLRPLTIEDIPFAMRMKELAGWNQLSSDWEFLIESGEGGNFVATYEGKEAGTATTLSYEDRFSWIGMVLVDPLFRGLGIGTVLLKSAIEFAQHRGTVRLDATPQGRKLYETLGFVTERELARFERIKQTGSLPEPSGKCIPVSEEVMNTIIDKDAAIFGANRKSVLQYLNNNSPQYAYCLKQGNQINGYCFGRTGSKFEQIGPVIAQNIDDAKDLLTTALASCVNKRVIIDAFTDNDKWTGFIESIGFQVQRPFFRMNKGELKHPGNTTLQYSIAGAELG